MSGFYTQLWRSYDFEKYKVWPILSQSGTKGSAALRFDLCGATAKGLNTHSADYLKVSALFIDGNDEPVDVSNKLIALRLPEAIRTLLQQLHQHLLNTWTQRNPCKRQYVFCPHMSLMQSISFLFLLVQSTVNINPSTADMEGNELIISSLFIIGMMSPARKEKSFSDPVEGKKHVSLPTYLLTNS